MKNIDIMKAEVITVSVKKYIEALHGYNEVAERHKDGIKTASDKLAEVRKNRPSVEASDNQKEAYQKKLSDAIVTLEKNRNARKEALKPYNDTMKEETKKTVPAGLYNAFKTGFDKNDLRSLSKWTETMKDGKQEKYSASFIKTMQGMLLNAGCKKAVNVKAMERFTELFLTVFNPVGTDKLTVKSEGAFNRDFMKALATLIYKVEVAEEVEQ